MYAKLKRVHPLEESQQYLWKKNDRKQQIVTTTARSTNARGGSGGGGGGGAAAVGVGDGGNGFCRRRRRRRCRLLLKHNDTHGIARPGHTASGEYWKGFAASALAPACRNDDTSACSLKWC
jgi:hypothetical protein